MAELKTAGLLPRSVLGETIICTDAKKWGKKDYNTSFTNIKHLSGAQKSQMNTCHILLTCHDFRIIYISIYNQLWTNYKMLLLYNAVVNSHITLCRAMQLI